MNLKSHNRFEDKLWTPRTGQTPLGQALRFPLYALSGLYKLAVTARRRAYRAGWMQSEKVGAKTVVIGNLTVGGSGKTPLAGWLASRLKEHGLDVAVVSRGYKGAAGTEPLVVSEGGGPLTSPSESGDEPYLLAQSLKDIPVIAFPERARACELAVKKFGATHIVLDDGYQHLKLQRDLDVLVLDAAKNPDDLYLLPRGPLREPVSAAASAGMVVISGAESDKVPAWEWLDRYCHSAPVFAMHYRARGLTPMGGEGISPVDLPSFAFSALGSPEGFVRSLAEAEVNVVGSRTFPDHYPYSAADLAALADQAKRAGARRLVTTEKDAVKIEPAWLSGFPLDVFRVRIDLFGAEEEFLETVLAKLGEKETAA